jgi:hypothetical protein
VKPEITIKIYKSEPYAEITGINEVTQTDMEMLQKIIDIVALWIKTND